MHNVQDVIDKIIKGEFNENELLEYLDSRLVLIKANAIMAIIKLKLTDKRIVDKLYENSLHVKDGSKLMGLWTNGHLAIAALKLLNTSESLELFNKSFSQLDQYTQRDIERLISSLEADLAVMTATS